jgi:hypothetical protein
METGMELDKQLLGTAAVVFAAAAFVFWMLRAMVTDLRATNLGQQAQLNDQQKQISDNLIAVSTHLGRITVLERQTQKCEEERNDFRRKMAAVAETCPITNVPCPLRVIFKGPP